ncbi:MATE family efflux transporter [Actinotalea sp. M2MS4P-6]|uniref:MATE family efflux transporter n=1 Tax=Actinotalea sp. M2MS4P-6 TaxID=2983762 RepID=UPI0021E511F1|nr:MATE family efflux transporter [Actinotalea sp. M2MS4P-6]MCV2392869.1 MATE family efflux transporter [Actinotalea sp. M2MS4P-6]
MARSSPNGQNVPAGVRSLDRQVLALAVPAFGALVAEPLFVLVDSAVVGTLGTTPLAGLGLASTVLTTVVGLCVFLAYATTAQVARGIGAGHRRDALRQGVDGMWLGLLLGAVLAVGLWLAAPALASALGAPADVVAPAVTYLRWSAPGLPGMLLVLAATGVLRGLLDTRTPLWVAGAGAALNAILSVTLVLGLGMGVAGSGLGTAVTQLLMALVLGAVVVRAARPEGVPLRPGATGLGGAVVAGAPLLVRTVSLRAAILLATWVAAGLGTVALAGHQAVASIWGFTAFALDALAIAAQALVGQRLGAADVGAVRGVLRRTVTWGVAGGAVLGALVAVAAWPLARLFTDDPAVHQAIAWTLWLVALMLPMSGWVFVLDGVLIGAGDGRYLAWVGMLTLAVYAPAALAVRTWAPPGPTGLVWAWLAFGGLFMAARAATTGLRARGTAWMRTGV